MIGGAGNAAEDLGLEPLEIGLEPGEDGEIAVHDRVHDGVEDEARSPREVLGLGLGARPDVLEAVRRLAAHRQHVVATDEDGHFADDEVAVRVGRVDVDRLQHGEHARPVFLDLGPLVALPRVLDGEFVQAELLGHQREFLIAGFEQRHPDEAIGPDDVVRDCFDADVGQLPAVLVRDAVDDHVLSAP